MYYIPVHTQPYYRAIGFAESDYPEAERYYREALSLPNYSRLTDLQLTTSTSSRVFEDSFMTIIESERLLFRTLSQEDITVRYLNWLNDPQVNQFLETRSLLQTLDSCNKFVSDMNADPLSHLLGIFDKESLEHIGNIKLGFINNHHQTGQLSLLIGEKPCWGKGYATESIKIITQWGFNTLNLQKISAGCYDTNIGSLRAFLKSGYSVEGYFRNSVVSADGRRIGSFWLGILRSDRVE